MNSGYLFLIIGAVIGSIGGLYLGFAIAAPDTTPKKKKRKQSKSKPKKKV